MERWLFRLALVAAIVMLAITPLFALPSPPCHPLPMPTMTAFELMRTMDDVHRILGAAGDACRAPMSAQLDSANLLDSFAYIPAYTLFYGLTAAALGRKDRTLGWITIVLCLGCAVADWVENVSMFAISAQPDEPGAWLIGLTASTSAKWVGLGVVTSLSGLMAARRGGLGWLVLIASVAPLVTSLLTLASPDVSGQYLMPGMIIATVALLLVDIVGAVRRGGTAADTEA